MPIHHCREPLCRNNSNTSNTKLFTVEENVSYKIFMKYLDLLSNHETFFEETDPNQLKQSVLTSIKELEQLHKKIDDRTTDENNHEGKYLDALIFLHLKKIINTFEKYKTERDKRADAIEKKISSK